MQENRGNKKLSRRETWIEDIKLMLGGSRILSLEINEDEISRLIDIAYRKMFPNVTDTDIITKPYANVISLENDNVEEVLKVIPASRLTVTTGSGTDELLFDFQAYRHGKVDKLALMRKAISPDVNIPFEYVAQSKKLYITEGYTTGNISIEVSRSVIDLENLRDDRAQTWIYEYALALSKEVVGRIRSKAKSSNVPIELDGDTLLSEAASEKEKLETQLNEGQYGPTIILR